MHACIEFLVIDFCLTKQQQQDKDSGCSRLQLMWASKSNCVQRSGRAGRVSEGRCYRLVSKQFYDLQLDKHATPEILVSLTFFFESFLSLIRCGYDFFGLQRSPLENLVLKAKRLNLGPPATILCRALDAPKAEDLERTILVLKQVLTLFVWSQGHGHALWVGFVCRLGR